MTEPAVAVDVNRDRNRVEPADGNSAPAPNLNRHGVDTRRNVDNRLDVERRKKLRRLTIPALLAALIVAATVALLVGAFPVTLADIGSAVTHGLSGTAQTSTATEVIWNIRLPRVLLAIVVGACLACAGTIMQGVFANPLAEPGIVGVSSGAAVGAVTVIILGLTAIGGWVLPAAAFVAGLLVTAAVYTLSRVNGRSEVLTLVLVGIAVNAFGGALIGLVMSVSDDAQLRSITFWNLGSLSAATWPAVLTVAPFAVLGVAMTPLLAGKLDLLSLGERSAAHLGVNVEAVRRWSILLVALLTAAAVAVAGIIVFVGLVIPHAVRMVVGPRHHLLIPATALAGATLLVVADTVSRTVVAPREIPLGVLTALVGSPVFFWLLRREHARRGAWA